MDNKILFNGKEYNNIEEMPPDARRAYEAAMGQFNEMFADADRDGLPDIFETLTTGTQNAQVFTTSKIFFNGQAYNRLEDMPPEARQQYQQAFRDQNRDGVPDVFETMGQVSTLQAAGKVPARPPMPTSPVHTSVGISPKVWLVVAGVVILFLFILVAGLVFLLFT